MKTPDLSSLEDATDLGDVGAAGNAMHESNQEDSAKAEVSASHTP